jgi:hypothetical protein
MFWAGIPPAGFAPIGFSEFFPVPSYPDDDFRVAVSSLDDELRAVDVTILTVSAANESLPGAPEWPPLGFGKPALCPPS